MFGLKDRNDKHKCALYGSGYCGFGKGRPVRTVRTYDPTRQCAYVKRCRRKRECNRVRILRRICDKSRQKQGNEPREHRHRRASQRGNPQSGAGRSSATFPIRHSNSFSAGSIHKTVPTFPSDIHMEFYVPKIKNITPANRRSVSGRNIYQENYLSDF